MSLTAGTALMQLINTLQTHIPNAAGRDAVLQDAMAYGAAEFGAGAALAERHTHAVLEQLRGALRPQTATPPQPNKGQAPHWLSRA